MKLSSFALGLSLMAMGAFSTTALGAYFGSPVGTFASTFGRLEYDPSRACARPFYSKSLREGVDELLIDNYKNMTTTNLDCMKRAAQSDSRYANNAIQEGLDKASDKIVADFERFVRES